MITAMSKDRNDSMRCCVSLQKMGTTSQNQMCKFLDLQTMSARRRLWCAWPKTSTQTTSQCPGRLTGGSKRSALRRTAEPSGLEGTTESAAG